MAKTIPNKPQPEGRVSYADSYLAAGARYAAIAAAGRGPAQEILNLPKHQQQEALAFRERDAKIIALEKAGVPHELGELSPYAPKAKRAVPTLLDDDDEPSPVDQLKAKISAIDAKYDAIEKMSPAERALRQAAPNLFEPVAAIDPAAAQAAQAQAQLARDLERQNELAHRPWLRAEERRERDDINDRLRRSLGPKE